VDNSPPRRGALRPIFEGASFELAHAAPASRGSRLRIGLGFLLSIAALAVLAREVQPRALLSALLASRPGWLLAMVAVRLGLLAAQTWRWQALLVGLAIPFRAALDAMVLGTAANNVLPVRAGELVRVAWLSRKTGRDPGGILVSVGIERAMDITALGVLALGVGLGAVRPGGLGAGASVVRLAACGVGVVALAWAVLYWSPLVPSSWRFRLGVWVGRARVATQDRFRLLPLLRGTLRTVVLWAASALWVYAAGRAVGLHLSGFQSYFVLAAVSAGVAVPAAPGSIGTFHLSCVVAMVWLGFAPDLSAAMAVVLHGVPYAMLTCWGLALGWGSLQIRATIPLDGPAAGGIG